MQRQNFRIEEITDNNGSRADKTNQSDNVKEFLRSLGKVECHYCRASYSKFYLEPI